MENFMIWAMVFAFVVQCLVIASQNKRINKSDNLLKSMRFDIDRLYKIEYIVKDRLDRRVHEEEYIHNRISSLKDIDLSLHIKRFAELEKYLGVEYKRETKEGYVKKKETKES